MDYLICTTPRSGSRSAPPDRHEGGRRAEGVPLPPPDRRARAEDVLRRTIEGHHSRFQRYYDGVRAAYTSGGRFGNKVHLHEVLGGGARLRPRRQHAAADLTRADVLGQAISFVRASQTGAWIAAKPEQREPSFDAEAITKAIRFMRQQDEKWEQLFERAGVEPYRMAYETLVADMDGSPASSGSSGSSATPRGSRAWSRRASIASSATA